MDKDKVDYESCEFWALRDAISENAGIVARIKLIKNDLRIDIVESEKDLINTIRKYNKEIKKKMWDLDYDEIAEATIKLRELYKEAKPIEKRLLEMLDKLKRDW